MEIVIDCRMYGKSGIGTYMRATLPYLLEGKEKHKFLLIGDKEKLNIFQKGNIKICQCDISPFSLGELKNFPKKLVNEYDVFYTPNYNIPWGIKIPIYSTIHDVVFMDIPELVKNSFSRIMRKFFLKRALKVSDLVFTVSNFSKNRIEKHFGNEKKIAVTGNGISSHLINYKPQDFNKGDDYSYIIFVGNIKKHKGLKILLDAFEIVQKYEFNKKLIIVGDSENFRTKDDEVLKFTNSVGKDNVIFTGYVSDEKLREMILNADALIQPSLYEGFGIPPMEALFLGTEAIISDIDVFKEIYSDLPVRYFKTGDSKSLAEELVKPPLKISGEVREIILEKFSYKKTAEIIMNEILKEGRKG